MLSRLASSPKSSSSWTTHAYQRTHAQGSAQGRSGSEEENDGTQVRNELVGKTGETRAWQKNLKAQRQRLQEQRRRAPSARKSFARRRKSAWFLTEWCAFKRRLTTPLSRSPIRMAVQ